MTAGQAQAFFDPVNGIGLSLFRDQIESDSSSCSTTCVFPASATLNLAIPYGVKVFGTPLSPPASMKTNGFTTCTGGVGNGALSVGSYGAFATYLKNYATQFKTTFGVSPAAISVQNEPEYCASYDAALYTGAQIQTFVKNNLGPTLNGTGVPVMMPEDGNWTTIATYADPCMTDASCSPYISYVAAHDYLNQEGNPLSSITSYTNQGNAHYWITEGGDGNTPWATSNAMTGTVGALYWAQSIHYGLTAGNLNGYMFYRFIDDLYATGTYGFSTSANPSTFGKIYYTFGNWSKFVRPGCQRIDATAGQSGVLITAFNCPNGSFSIVAVNTNAGGGGTTQTFNLSNFPAITQNIVVWNTSSSNNLASIGSMSPATSFSYLLPASSVTTFVGQTGSTTPWTGIISSARAMDWSKAGVIGGIPSGSWSQCGATLPAATTTAAQIQTAITNCGTNQYVLLGPGTFNLAASIDFLSKNNVELRGSGANSTFLVFSAASATCGGKTAATQLIGMCGPDPSYETQPPTNVHGWTAGYTQGQNTVTFDSTTGIVPVGSGSPTMLIMNQDDTGFSSYPAAGSSVDNGNYFVCAPQYSAGTGCSDNGQDAATPGNFLNFRWQHEVGIATAVNSGTGVVTLQQPLKHANWNSTQVPKVWFFSTMMNSGITNMSISLGSTGAVPIAMYGCYGCWISGVRINDFSNWGILALVNSHSTISNNYIFKAAAAADPYGIRAVGNGDMLIQNNIVQDVRSPIVFDFWDVGSVVAYNFTINDNTSATGGGNMSSSLWCHSAGCDFHLWEGNISAALAEDNIHGVHLNETAYRNFFSGWESCASGNCGGSTAKGYPVSGLYTDAVGYRNEDRYGNVVGNIVGTPGYHNNYILTANQNSGNAGYVYAIGSGNVAPSDPLTLSTMLLWDNYDTYHASVQENISEVPTGAPVYPNPVPTKSYTGAGGGLPCSFYLSCSVRPSWWAATIPFPAIGPDVTAGNVGQCTGSIAPPQTIAQAGVAATAASQCTGTGAIATAWGGHINANPAMANYLSAGGRPDGTGPVLNLNLSYTSAGGSPIASILPSNLAFITNQLTTSAPQTITVSNIGTATLNVTTVTVVGSFSNAGGTCGTAPFSVGAGASCTVLITFSPGTTGPFTGSVTFSDNAPSSPQVITLSGTGTAPIIMWSCYTYSFGNVPIGNVLNSIPCILYNTGNGPLSVNLSFTGTNPSYFSLNSSTCSSILAAGSNCQVVVQFAPTLVQSYSAFLTETDPLQGSLSLALLGTGVVIPTAAPCVWCIL